MIIRVQHDQGHARWTTLTNTPAPMIWPLMRVAHRVGPGQCPQKNVSIIPKSPPETRLTRTLLAKAIAKAICRSLNKSMVRMTTPATGT